MAVKGLTVMLCERPSPPPLPPPVKSAMTKTEVEDAVEAFMKQMEAAKGKLVERLVLGKAEADVNVAGGQFDSSWVT